MADRTFIGDSAALREVRDRIAALAGLDGPILIRGDRGTGKATAALSLVGDGPFTIVDCASSSDEQVLGAMTGQAAVVLREIGATGPELQDELARRVAGTGVPRVIATTTHDLGRPGEVGAEFNGDLLDRLSTATVALPPLRERTVDIAELCQHFTVVAARRERRQAWEAEPAVIDLFQQYAWPRNVRELRNLVERAYSVSGPGNPLRVGLIEPWLRAVSADPVTATVEALAGKPLADIEKQVILSTLQQFRGHRIKTAGALGIGVRTLGIKLKRWRDEGEPVIGHDRATAEHAR